MGKFFWQLPTIKEDGKCPVCGNTIIMHKKSTIMITPPDRKSVTPLYIETPFCGKCEIPLWERSLKEISCKKTGYGIPTFQVKDNCDLTAVLEQMDTCLAKSACSCKKDKRNGQFDLVPNEIIWRQVKKWNKETSNSLLCRRCHSELRKDYALIPVTKNLSVKIYGKKCSCCECIYIEDDSTVYRLLQDNPLTKDYTLNGIQLCNYSEIQKERLEKARLEANKRKIMESIPEAQIMIFVAYDKEKKEYIITRKKSPEDLDDVFCYNSKEGIELLSAAYAKERQGKGSLNNQDFIVERVVVLTSSVNGVPARIMPDELCLSSGGGFGSSIKNNRYEIVDLLLYSPFNKRLEILHATYDKENDRCFVDARLFRHFVENYGNPQIGLDYFVSHTKSFMYTEWNTESILKEFGYNVSQKEGLSSRERRAILEDLMDLEIIKDKEIIDLLKFFCNTHSGEKYHNARATWKSDMEYVKNYKVNPNRFLIGGVGR